MFLIKYVSNLSTIYAHKITSSYLLQLNKCHKIWDSETLMHTTFLLNKDEKRIMCIKFFHNNHFAWYKF